MLRHTSLYAEILCGIRRWPEAINEYREATGASRATPRRGSGCGLPHPLVMTSRQAWR
jgi:hypothetical protein